MDDLFLLLALTSGIAFIIGMISPKAIKMSDRKKVLQVYGSIMIAAFILFGITIEPSNGQKPETTSALVESTESKEKPEDSKQEVKKITKKESKKSASTISPDEIKTYISSALMGRTFINQVNVTDDRVEITYHTFESYKNTGGNIKEADYNMYWDTGDAINKVLMGESVRILYKYPNIKEISMMIPFKGKNYSLSLDRETAKNYFNIDLDNMTKETYKTEYNDPYVYNKEQRKAFADKFIKVN